MTTQTKTAAKTSKKTVNAETLKFLRHLPEAGESVTGNYRIAQEMQAEIEAQEARLATVCARLAAHVATTIQKVQATWTDAEIETARARAAE